MCSTFLVSVDILCFLRFLVDRVATNTRTQLRGLTILLARLPTSRAHRAGLHIPAPRARSLLLQHWSPQWLIPPAEATAPAIFKFRFLRAEGTRMDYVLTLYLSQTMATPRCKISSGQHDRRNGQHHVLADPGSVQFHHGPMAVRVCLFANCVVSL